MRRFLAAALVLTALLAAGLACDRVTPVAPAGSTITLSVNPSRIAAQGEDATVTAIVREEDGSPVNPGTQVNFSTTLGTLDPEVATTDETGVAKTRLTGDGRIGDAEVTATTGAAAAQAVSVQIGSVAASITLNATPSDVSKNPPPGGDVIELLALIRDDTGAALEGNTVSFDSDIGRLASAGAAVVTNELGEAKDTLTVTRDNLSVLFEPFFEVRAQTAVTGGNLIEDVVEILVRGAPATITLQATPSTVAEEGGVVTLTALVRDTLGDPLAGAGVNFLTDLGSLASLGGVVTTDAQGQARDTLTITEADVRSLGAAITFEVRAQTAGLGGQLLEDSFQMRKVSCRPTPSFECKQISGRQYSFLWTGGVDPGDPLFTFEWTFVRASGLEATRTGSSTLYTFLSAETYDVTLEVTDGRPGCEISSTRSVPLVAGTAPSNPSTCTF